MKDIGALIAAYEAKSFTVEDTIRILSNQLQNVRDKIAEFRQTEAYIEEKIALYEETRDMERLVRAPSKRKKHSLKSRRHGSG